MDRNTELVGTERELLTQFLDSQRGGVLDAVTGLTHEQLHRRLVGSATTIGALLKHLALVEDSWFQRALLDQELPEPWASAPLDLSKRRLSTSAIWTSCVSSSSMRSQPRPAATDQRELYPPLCA